MYACGCDLHSTRDAGIIWGDSAESSLGSGPNSIPAGHCPSVLSLQGHGTSLGKVYIYLLTSQSSPKDHSKVVQRPLQQREGKASPQRGHLGCRLTSGAHMSNIKSMNFTLNFVLFFLRGMGIIGMSSMTPGLNSVYNLFIYSYSFVCRLEDKFRESVLSSHLVFEAESLLLLSSMLQPNWLGSFWQVLLISP